MNKFSIIFNLFFSNLLQSEQKETVIQFFLLS